MKRFLTLLWLLPLFSAVSKAGGSTFPSPTLSAAKSEVVCSDNEWRRYLPPGLRKEGAPLHRINMNGVILYLLGSSHVSRNSCEDVKLLIKHVRPDALFVELCSQRAGLLLRNNPLMPSAESEKQLKLDGKEEELKMTPMSSRGSVLFAKIQSDYARKMNVTIGGEFHEAFECALSQQRQFCNYQQSCSPWEMSLAVHPRGNRPCAVVLGDRPVRITLLRAWDSLRFTGKVKLMVALIWSLVRQPSEKELREWMESILNDRSGKNDLITKAM